MIEPDELQIDSYADRGFTTRMVWIRHKPTGITVEATHESPLEARRIAMRELERKLGEEPGGEDSARSRIEPSHAVLPLSWRAGAASSINA